MLLCQMYRSRRHQEFPSGVVLEGRIEWIWGRFIHTPSSEVCFFSGAEYYPAFRIHIVDRLVMFFRCLRLHQRLNNFVYALFFGIRLGGVVASGVSFGDLSVRFQILCLSVET